jgi:hypothetical protein
VLRKEINPFFMANNNSLLSSHCKTIKKQTSLPILREKIRQSLTMEDLYKDIKVEPKVDISTPLNKLLTKTVGLNMSEDTGVKGDEAKIRKLEILSNVKWKNDPLNPQNFFLEGKEFISCRAGEIQTNKTHTWLGREQIDIISLENLLKSFFKKMYSLISLPILEYLPDK